MNINKNSDKITSYCSLPRKKSFFNKPIIMSDNEKFELLTKKTVEIISSRINKEVPEKGHFIPIGQHFSIPGTKNRAMFIVRHNTTAPLDKRSLILDVSKDNTDINISYVLMSDSTKKDIQEYLKKANLEDLMNDINNLSNTVDRHNL